MNCETTRMAISALLDGELPAERIDDVERHLDGCADCRAWQESAHDLTRRTRLARAEPPARPSADARGRIHAAAGRASRGREVGALRVLLVAAALAQLGVTIPLLIFGRYDVARDLGAMDMALAVGFVIVGWRPGRARAIAPVIGTAAGLLLITAVLGVIRDGEALGSEAPHVIAFAGWLLVWRLGRVTSPNVESPDGSRWNRVLADALRFDRSSGPNPPERPLPPEARRELGGGGETPGAMPTGSDLEREARRAAA